MTDTNKQVKNEDKKPDNDKDKKSENILKKLGINQKDIDRLDDFYQRADVKKKQQSDSE